MGHNDDVSDLRRRLHAQADVLFPKETGRSQQLVEELLTLAERYRSALSERVIAPMDAGTSYLITYGDSFTRVNEPPLRTLGDVLTHQIKDAVSDVHLLPMFPWTSDDGFAVVDYREINPELGTWADIAALGEAHQLMFDFVANHTSASSPWVKGWLSADPAYANYYVTPGPNFDTSHVVRPRTTPLLHEFERSDGSTVNAWTTFGRDQLDVNAANPATLLDLTDVLLGYLARGAVTIRLDAIGYLWKEDGTTCLHRPGTHAIIKMWRALVDDLIPGARLLTETNVPHADNITYLGNGADEAHMVYQFALPPLVLHTFLSGNSRQLTDWAAALEPLGTSSTWFNFLASHDGIGMRPAEGTLTPAECEALIQRALDHGGRASYASSAQGGESVYELNVSYLNALVKPEQVTDTELVVARALAAHAILFALAGVPAIYYHSLFGSSHDADAMRTSGINRRINRAKIETDALLNELDPTKTPSARRIGIFSGLTQMLLARRALAAFDPFAPQEILDLGEDVFAVQRGQGNDIVLVVVNVSGQPVTVPGVVGTDLLTGQVHQTLTLPADGFVWLATSS